MQIPCTTCHRYSTTGPCCAPWTARAREFCSRLRVARSFALAIVLSGYLAMGLGLVLGETGLLISLGVFAVLFLALLFGWPEDPVPEPNSSKAPLPPDPFLGWQQKTEFSAPLVERSVFPMQIRCHQCNWIHQTNALNCSQCGTSLWRPRDIVRVASIHLLKCLGIAAFFAAVFWSEPEGGPMPPIVITMVFGITFTFYLLAPLFRESKPE